MRAYRFHHVPHKVQPAETVGKDIEVAQEKMSIIKPIVGPVGVTVDAIGAANTVMVQLDTISAAYLEPLRIFNVVVTGISNVRFFIYYDNRACINDVHRSIHTLRWR